jgi:hypothetical protein
MVHLRDVEGIMAANKSRPDVTHELLIVALSPEAQLPKVDGPEFPVAHMLTPVDVAEQVTLPDDGVASILVDEAVKAIVEGQLSPDQDFRTAWRIWTRSVVSQLGSHRHA